jgi:hypothetical protein
VTLTRDNGCFAQLSMVTTRATRIVLEQLESALRVAKTIRRVRIAIPTLAEFKAQAPVRAALEATCRELGIAITIEKAAR